MKVHQQEFRVTTICRVLGVQRARFYMWPAAPVSDRAKEDRRLSGLARRAWLESDTVYGYRKVAGDRRGLGETCGKHQIYRLIRAEGLKAQVGYGRRLRPRGGLPSTVAPNRLDRQLTVPAANTHWVSDITYIRTHEGWIYLAVVLDLFSRQIVGWATQDHMHADLVLQALTLAVWRRKPESGLMLHSDQGSQFNGGDWQAFLKAHGIVCSMSRRGTATKTRLLRAACSCSSGGESGARSTWPGQQPGAACSTTSRCSTNPAVPMAPRRPLSGRD